MLTNSPDLFLLDVMLPDGSGLDLCKDLRIAKTKMIPIILMTAHYEGQQMAKANDIDGYLQKPFDIDHLAAMVRSLLE